MSRGRSDAANKYLLQSAQIIEQVLAEFPADSMLIDPLSELLVQIQNQVDTDGTTGEKPNGGGDKEKGKK